MKYLNPYLQKETLLDTTILLINFYIFSIFIYAFKKKKKLCILVFDFKMF